LEQVNQEISAGTLFYNNMCSMENVRLIMSENKYCLKIPNTVKPPLNRHRLFSNNLAL
jgi:hypothetical protein